MNLIGVLVAELHVEFVSVPIVSRGFFGGVGAMNYKESNGIW